MTRRRGLIVMWAVIGAALWLGVFDYITQRGTNEYLFRNAELRLGIQPAPGKSADMREVMAAARLNAAIQATVWAVVVMGAGIFTVRSLSRSNS
jgi:hypothetical protein